MEFYGSDFDDVRDWMVTLKNHPYCSTPEHFMGALGIFAGRWSDFIVNKLDQHRTGNIALDGIADLPGPGSLSLPGNAQFFAGP